MKKIVNICFLVIICLLPIVVDAKSNLDLEYEIKNRYFLYEEEGNYYYLDPDWDDGDLYSYDVNGDFIKSDILFPNSMTKEEIFATKEFKEMKNYNIDFGYNNTIYDEETGINYYVYLDDSIIEYYDNDNNLYSYKFEEKPDLAKKLLGEKYDIYYEIKDENKYILQILVYDNIFAVYYEDEDYNYFVEIYDKKYNLIKKYDFGELFEYPFVKEIDGMIYITIGTSKLNVYKYNGELYNSYDLSFDYNDSIPKNYCGLFYVANIYALNNKLFIVYDSSDCAPQRVEIFGDNEVANFSKELYLPEAITQVYSLIYDVDKVNSSSGDFTYEEVTGDDGNIYVELDIKPATGYIVKEIIVTDVNGNKIEVTDNKFIKPMNDVKVEVKYEKGEYLPIPDTFLSRSLTLSIIGLVLVGLGIYTFNYVRKVD